VSAPILRIAVSGANKRQQLHTRVPMMFVPKRLVGKLNRQLVGEKRKKSPSFVRPVPGSRLWAGSRFADRRRWTR